MKLKERWSRLVSRHERYRLRWQETESKYVIEMWSDPARNGLYMWCDIEMPQDVVDAVVVESKNHDLEFTEDSLGLVFNYELLLFYKRTVSEWNQRVLDERRQKFLDSYEQV